VRVAMPAIRFAASWISANSTRDIGAPPSRW
jgi:hypothetical protein